MAETWTGTFTNETFAGPGAYQAKNGVRCFIDMATTPGPVVVNAIVSPADHSSSVIAWDNPNREIITFASADNFEDPGAILRALVASYSTTVRRGLLGLTFINGNWEVFNWNNFGVSLSTSFAVAWTGQNTNGLCTLQGTYNVVEVERTALGFYTVRVEPGVLATGLTVPIGAPVATGLPAENSPEIRVEDIGVINVDEVLVNTGLRNKNGQFSDNDLIQDPSNVASLIGQQFP